jgi:hypothetical protein
VTVVAYRLQIRVSNPDPVRAVTSTIYAGAVFEVLDPFSRVQSLAPVRDVTVTVPPGTSQIVEVDSWCLNHFFAAPANTSLRPTSLRLARTYASQADLWSDLDGKR